MGQNRVEFVLAAEDSKAILAAAKLLESARAAGDEFDKTGKKGKSSFDDVGRSILNVAASVASGLGAMQMMQAALDAIQAKAEAINRELEKTGQANVTYENAFGRVLSNMPGASHEEIRQLDASLKEIAGGSALGAEGLPRLTDAYATVQSSIPLAGRAQKMDVIREAAQAMELTPTADPTDIALGYAKLMEASGFTISANQAQNQLMTQQGIGSVDDPAKVSRMIPRLAVASKVGQVSMQDMQALAAWMTQVGGDTGGEQTTTVLSMLSSKLMQQTDKIEETTGIRLQGNLLERLDQFRAARRSGAITDAQLAKALPEIGAEGATGRSAITALFDDESYQQLQTFRKIMNDPAMGEGDRMADLIVGKRGTPGMRHQEMLRREQSALTVERAGDDPMVQMHAETQIFRERLEREMRPQGYIDLAVQNYVGLRGKGFPKDQAEEQSRNPASAYWYPAVGWVMGKIGASEYSQGIEAIQERGYVDRPAQTDVTEAVRQGVVEGLRQGRNEAGGRVGNPET